MHVPESDEIANPSKKVFANSHKLDLLLFLGGSQHSSFSFLTCVLIGIEQLLTALFPFVRK